MPDLGGVPFERQILQMVFDNSQFDKRIAKSQKTVEDFKDVMDFGAVTEGLSRFSSLVDSLSLSNFADNIEALTNKFTGLGEISEYVISRVRAGFEGAAKSVESFVKSLSIDQISVGEEKYNALNKAVMTIINTEHDGIKYTEEEAYAAFERLMTYTNETSYSFSDMVGSISNFVAVGLGLSESERAIEGIANASAKAGQGISEASSAMTVFSKAMGAGYLDKNKWDSLNLTARMITGEFRRVIAETAVEVGTLNKEGDKYRVAPSYRSDAAQKVLAELNQLRASNDKSKKTLNRIAALEKKAAEYENSSLVALDNLENSLHNKWLTKEVMMQALQKYYFEGIDNPDADWDTFAGSAAKAAQRALSLKDALNAMKEAVSAGWLTSYRLFWGDLSEAMVTFTSIANRAIVVIDRIADIRNRLVAAWADKGGRRSILNILIGDYDKEVIDGIYGLADMIEDAGEFLYDTVMDFFKIFVPSDLKKHWDDEGFKESWLSSALYSFTNSISRMFGMVRDFFDGELLMGDGQVKTRLQIFHEIVSGIVGAAAFGYQMLTAIFGFIKDVGKQLGPSFDAILVFLSELGVTIYDASADANSSQTLRKFFHDLAEELRPLTDGINTFIISLTELLGIIIDVDQKTGTTEGILKSFGNFLKQIANVLSTVGKPILIFLRDFAVAMGELFQNGFTPENVQAAGEKLATSFKLLLATLLGSLPVKTEFIQNWINMLLGVDAITSAAEPAKETLFGNIKALFTDIFTNIYGFLTQTAEEFDLGVMLDTIVSSVKNSALLQGALNFFKKVNLFAVLMAFLGVTAIASLWRLIVAARRAVENVTNIIRLFTQQSASGFVAKANELSEAILNMAKAVALVSAAMAILGSMPIGTLVQGVLSVIVVIGALLGFAAILSKMSNGNKLSDKFALAGQILSLAAFMVIVSASIGLIMLVITPLAANPERFAVAVAGVVVLLAAVGILMTGIVYLAKSITSKNSGLAEEQTSFWKIALAMLAISAALTVIAASVSLMALAITPIAALGWDALWRGLLAIAGILTLFGVFMAVMIRVMTGKDSKEMLKSSGTMLVWATSLVATSIAIAIAIGALAASLTLMMGAIIPLALLKPDNWIRGMLGLIIVLGSLLEFMKAIKTLKLNSVQITGLSAFAGGITLLIRSLNPLAKMSWEGWVRAMGGFALVLVMIGHFMKTIKELEIDNIKIAGLIGFAFGLGVLMLALTPLALMSWEGWIRSLLGLMVVMGLLIGFMEAIKVLKIDNVKIIGLAGFAIGIALMMMALNTISGIAWTDLGKALLGMLGVMALLLIFMKALERYEITQNVKIVGIIGFAAGIWLLVQALIPLAGMSMGEIFTGVTGLLGVLFAVGMFLKALDGVKVDLGKSITLIVMMIAIAGLMVILALTMEGLKGTDPWLIVSFAGGLAVMIFAMAFVIAMLSAIPFGAGLKGIALLAAGIAAIMGVLALMLPLIIKGVGNGLADAGGKLELASGTITGFIDRINAISDNDTEHATNVLEKIKGILESASGMSSYGTNIGNFTTTLYDLGTGLAIFNGHAQTLAEQGISSALQLLSDLAQSIPNLMMLSTLDLRGFTSNLTGMAGAMSLYAIACGEVKGSGNADAPSVSTAVGILKQISTELVNAGGFKIPEDMPSEEALGLFGAQLAALALALVQFEQAGSQLGEGTAKALSCLDFLSQIKIKLTAIGAIDDVISYFTGKDRSVDVFEEFGKNIEQLGLSLAKFAESTTITDEETGEIKPIDFTDAITALNNFVSLQERLPDIPPEWATWIFGTTENLNDLAGKIESLGTALKDFYDKTETAVGTEDKRKNLTAAIDAIDAFIDMQIKIPDEEQTPSIISWATGRKKTIEDMTRDLGEVGANLASFSVSAQKAVATDDQKTAVKNALEAIDAYIDMNVKIPDEEHTPSIFSWLNGRKKTVGDMTRDMSEVGTALVSFSTSATAAVATESQKQAIFTAIGLIDDFIDVELKSSIGQEKNEAPEWMQSLTGRKKNLTDAAAEMRNIGGAIVAFSADASAAVATEEQKQAIAAAIMAIDDFIDVKLKLAIGQEKNEAPEWMQFLTGRKDNLNDAADEMKNIGGALVTFSQNATEAVGTKEKQEAMTAATTAFGTLVTFMLDLNTQLPRVGGLANILDGLINGTKTSIEDVANDLGSIGESLAIFGENVSGKFTDTTSVTNAMDIIGKFSDILIALAGMDEEYRTMGFEPQTMARNFADFIDILAQGIAEDGTLIMNGTPNIVSSILHLMTGISAWANNQKNLDGNAIQSFRDMAQALTALSSVNVEKLKQDFQTVGTSLASGVALGIQAGQSTVFNAVKQMMIDAYKIAMGTIDASSPSKVFKEVGTYIPLGLAIGIDNGSGQVADSVSNMGENAINTATTLMTEVSRLLGEGLNEEPTITPVLDLDNVRNGIAYIDRNLRGKTLNLNTTVPTVMANAVGRQQALPENQNEINLSGIYERMTALHGDLAEMGQAIRNLRLILDTGVLAGAITDQIDLNLGRKSFYVGRRNY